MRYFALLLLCFCRSVSADSILLPAVAIIIDDLGNNYEAGRAAIELPHHCAYAVLPYSPHAKRLANLANARGKEVIVHLPMEANDRNHLLGPGALYSKMTHTEIESRVIASVAAVPHAVGINNHMGSRLTRETAPMESLMATLYKHGNLYFVDSRTTPQSVAYDMAKRSQLRATSRDIFIDNARTQQHIAEQLAMLVDMAHENGNALAIGHPHPLTIDALRKWRPESEGVELISLTEYVERHGLEPRSKQSSIN